VGISLLGEAFRGIKPLVAVLAVSSLSLSLCATLSLAIRARGLVATSLKVRVAAGAATLALAVPVASAFGAMGTAWLFSAASVATLVGLIVWCRPFRESVATLPAPV
jgi:O-antigen/teichoic acid export membrane protein